MEESNVDIDVESTTSSEDLFTPLSRYTTNERDGSFTQPLLIQRTNQTSQIAVFGAKVFPIESLDYEIIENELFKEDWKSIKKIEILEYTFFKWALALLIGLCTGFVGFCNNICTENIAGFKFIQAMTYLRQEKYTMAFMFFTGCNMVLAISSAALCAFVAPAAAGSGIPEVKAYLNGVDANSILAPSTLFVKVIGSILGNAAGFVVGKEGPMVHTGSCIAMLLGQGGSHKYGLTWKWLRHFKNDRDRRDLVTCGAAAGVAAAFRAPVGGVLFALEEVASWWRSALLWRTFFTTAVVAVVLRSLIGFCKNQKCGHFGLGGLIMFDVQNAASTWSTIDLVALVILGVVGGVLGSLYNYLVNRVLRTYAVINEKGPMFKILLVMTISLITSCCYYGLPWLAPCIPCPPESRHECPNTRLTGKYKSFSCQAGQYNDLASLMFTTNDDAIRNLFPPSEAEFHVFTLCIFFAAMFCLGIITYGIAIPSGLFIPVILAGASYGRLVGVLIRPICDMDPGLFAMLGAVSFLGGTMRMTVSICVIFLELTNDLLMLPLVMIVLLISKSVADNFNKGVYDQIVEIKGLPFMELHAELYMRYLTAGDVITGPLITLSSVEKVRTVMDALRSTRHNGFPVINQAPFVDAPELYGIVLRSHLLVLLKSKKFTKTREKMSSKVKKSLNAFDFAKPGSGKGLKIEDLTISKEEMDMYIDLYPITNASPYTVVETMSLAKAAILFGKLGLRHLCVVPKTPGRPPIIGILTRHDFTSEHILGLYPQLRSYK